MALDCVDFLLRHLPYASVVGGTAAAGVPVFAAFPRTQPLTLLTCPNEAVTILFALGLPRAFDAPNRLYLLLVMLALIPVELVEIAAALLFGAPAPTTALASGGVVVGGGDGGGAGELSFVATLPLRLVALLTVGAPLYHCFGVVPCCWRKLRDRRALLATSFESAAAEGEGGAATCPLPSSCGLPKRAL